MKISSAAAPWVVVSVVVVAAACTGDDPNVTLLDETADSGPSGRGDFGAPCYPNGTCNADLECKGGVCVAGESTDAGEPTDGGDSGTAPACTITPAGLGAACPLNGNPTASCGLTNGAVDACCSLLDSVKCDPSCADAQTGDTIYRCTTRSHCGTGLACCLEGATLELTGMACPDLRLATVRETRCNGTCSGPTLCSSNADCPNGQKCHRATVNMGGTDVILGVCQ